MNTPNGPEHDQVSSAHQMVATGNNQMASTVWAPPSQMWLDGTPGEEGIDLTSFLHCLRRKWLPGLLVGGVLATIVSALLWILIPISFEAISLVRVKRTEPYLLKKTISSDQEYMAYKQTQATLITSPFVLTAALREPGITQLPMVAREENQLDWLTDEIRVVYPGDSEIMQVGMHGDKIEDLKKIVDAVVKAYLYEIANSEKTEKSKQLQTLRAQRRINEQALKEKSEIINRLSEEIGSSDDEMARLRSIIEQDQLRQLNRQRAVVRGEIAQLFSDAMAVNVARNASRFFKPDEKDIALALERDPLYASAKQNISALEQLMTMSQAGRATGVANPYQAEYMSAQLALQRRREELTPLLEHELGRQLAGVDDSGSTTTLQVLQGQTELKKKQLAALDQEYEAQLERVDNLTSFSSDLITRKADAAALQESNHEMSKEIARLEIELKNEHRIQLVQPATIPNEGSHMLKMIEVVGGGVLTLFAAVFGIAMWDYKSRRLNSSKDVETGCHLPVIGTVPSLRSGVGGLLGGRGLSETVIADSFDSIRAAIMYGAPGRDIKSVLVTSAVGHEGKSTVASQLAVSLARAGRRTLLVDADIRNPQQHAVFGLPLDRGLCDVIRGQASLEEVIQATPAEGLWILPAGRFDNVVMQAISGPAFSQTMDRLREQFDFVILDSGPVLTGPGAIICGQNVDAAIISTRRDVSRLPKVEEAHRRLQSVGVYVIGSVVNGTKPDVRANQIALTAAN